METPPAEKLSVGSCIMINTRFLAREQKRERHMPLQPRVKTNISVVHENQSDVIKERRKEVFLNV